MRSPDPQRITGPNAVRALFTRRPEQVGRLFYTPEMEQFAIPLARYMARHRLPYRMVPSDELDRIAGTPHHNGIVAIAAPRRALPMPERLPDVLWSAPVLPVLDGVGNPHNLGAILRSAVFFGAKAVVISADPRQADLSDAVFRTSEGALEHLDLFRVEDLPAFLRRIAGRMAAVAATAAGGVAPTALPREKPFALVLGNEEDGPTPAAIAACPLRVTLPARGPVESLNVSNAAAVLLHALGG
jgi:TrmH RNA methyltransferase